jgi:5-methyltetrahydropteroyltriglutamate--homocysteine methyltransferase
MKRSTDRIITTHVGSLPRPLDLIGKLFAKDNGLPYDGKDLAQRVKASVAEVVKEQLEDHIDVVNDGEHSKSSFSAYTGQRMGGFEVSDTPFGHVGASRDRIEFKAVYEENAAIYAGRPSRIQVPRKHQGYACTGPLRYIGHDAVKTDIENMKAALAGRRAHEVFMTALSPNNVALYYENKYYKNEEEYSVAIADAMREEYKAIIDAGFLLQVDDPRLATHYDRHPDSSIEECRRVMAKQVEIVNYALKGIPEDRVRFHTCYSTNVAPRVNDLELKHYVDIMLKINAAGYTFEGANPRHDHEWKIWEEVKLPDHKVLIPGVVSHCVQLVEHPELVAQRIERYASVVGRERVIASNDCGFATAGAGDEVHPQVAWAKMKAMVEGARIASKRLWSR